MNYAKNLKGFCAELKSHGINKLENRELEEALRKYFGNKTITLREKMHELVKHGLMKTDGKCFYLSDGQGA